MNSVLDLDKSINSETRDEFRQSLNTASKLFNKHNEQEIKAAKNNFDNLRSAYKNITATMKDAVDGKDTINKEDFIKKCRSFIESCQKSSENSKKILGFEDDIEDIFTTLQNEAYKHKKIYYKQIKARESSKLFKAMKELKSVLQSEPSSNKIHDIKDKLDLVAESCSNTLFTDERAIRNQFEDLVDTLNH